MINPVTFSGDAPQEINDYSGAPPFLNTRLNMSDPSLPANSKLSAHTQNSQLFGEYNVSNIGSYNKLPAESTDSSGGGGGGVLITGGQHDKSGNGDPGYLFTSFCPAL